MTPQEMVAPCICLNPQCDVPYGFCHCRCGGKTPVAWRNHAKYYMVKGKPLRFMMGHCRSERKQPEDAQPFKIDGVYCRLIPLTKGLFAIVDAADYHWLMTYQWQAGRIGTRGVGYYAVCRGRIRMHQLIAGKGPDHANRVGIDNRRKNLRPATQEDNVKNASMRKDNTSGFRGVHPHSKKFAATIQVNGKGIFLGVRVEPRDAALLYDEAARIHHGRFANLNFP